MTDDLKERLATRDRVESPMATETAIEALAYITDLEARLAAAEAGEDALAEAGRKAVAQLTEHGSDGYASGLDAALAAYEARRKG